MTRLSIENGLEDALIANTRTLKRGIAERFPDDIFHYNKGKYLIVHCSDMKPCAYAIAILKSKGLRSNDIIRSFGALIHEKLRNAWKMKKCSNSHTILKSSWECLTLFHFLKCTMQIKIPMQFTIRSRVSWSWINMFMLKLCLQILKPKYELSDTKQKWKATHNWPYNSPSYW